MAIPKAAAHNGLMTPTFLLFIALLAPPDAIVKAIATEDAARAAHAVEAANVLHAAAAVAASELSQARAEAELAILEDLLAQARATVAALETERVAHFDHRTRLAAASSPASKGAPPLIAKAAQKDKLADDAIAALKTAVAARRAAIARLSTPPGPQQLAALEAALAAEQGARDLVERTSDDARQARIDVDDARADAVGAALHTRLDAELVRVTTALGIARQGVVDLERAVTSTNATIEALKTQINVGLKDEVETAVAAEHLAAALDAAMDARDDAIQKSAEAVGP